MSNTSHSFDVLVMGGGPAGSAAAIAAARTGARTALLERHPVLGGMGTAALVNNFCPAHLDGSRLIIGGIFAELRQLLIDRKALYASPGFAYSFEPYDPAVFASLIAKLAHDSGVTLFLGANVGSFSVPDDAPARFELADGQVLFARTVVDATGDAVVAAASGAAFTFGDLKTGDVMPLTLCYKLGPIDVEKLARARPEATRLDPVTGERLVLISGLHAEVAAAQAAGTLTIPRDHVAALISVPGQPQNATVNFGRVFIQDPTDPDQLAEAEKAGRAQVEEGIRFFRQYLPGCENVELLELARQIGVRESRQITGLYTLDGDDIRACRQFPDAIAQCCYAIDIHGPAGSKETTLEEIERGRHYDIPWRSLIPAQGPRNLVVAGRSISATPEAMSSFRVAPSVMAIGEAAGITAALAARNGAHVARVDPQAVRARLLATGGILT